jgi:hypothetical protein
MFLRRTSDGRHADLARERVHEALDEQDGFHAARAARRSERHRVGKHQMRFVVWVRDGIRACHAATRQGQRRAGPVAGRVGAEVHVVDHGERRDRAVLVAGNRRVLQLPATVHGRDRQPLASVHPTDRPADFAREKQHQRAILIEVAFGSVRAADGRHNHPQLVVRDAHDQVADHEAVAVRDLRVGPEGVFLVGRIERRDRRARLERLVQLPRGTVLSSLTFTSAFAIAASTAALSP